ncbi:hypothetical protein [Nonomuraea dietziae]|uniref:hypothetical protein n=1 Tax=Nonomuraea dietziae TaxID=65515 RepID=UPI0031D9832E
MRARDARCATPSRGGARRGAGKAAGRRPGQARGGREGHRGAQVDERATGRGRERARDRAHGRGAAPQGAGRAALPGRGGPSGSLSSLKVARWNRIGDAIKTGKSNPVRLAKGLKGAAKPVKRPVAPKRKPIAVTAQKDDRPGAAFQATSTTRTVEGRSVRLKPFRIPTGTQHPPAPDRRP